MGVFSINQNMLHLLFLHLGEEKKKRAETKMFALVYHGWIFGVPKKKATD